MSKWVILLLLCSSVMLCGAAVACYMCWPPHAASSIRLNKLLVMLPVTSSSQQALATACMLHIPKSPSSVF